jgi:hypothetical protein
LVIPIWISFSLAEEAHPARRMAMNRPKNGMSLGFIDFGDFGLRLRLPPALLVMGDSPEEKRGCRKGLHPRKTAIRR